MIAKLNRFLWIPRVMILLNAIYVIYLAFQYRDNVILKILIFGFFISLIRLFVNILLFVFTFKTPEIVGIIVMVILIISIINDLLSYHYMNLFTLGTFIYNYILACLLIILPKIIKSEIKK